MNDDRQAIILIPTFPFGHIDYPVLPMFSAIVHSVKIGSLPNYRRWKPDISTVWRTGSAPEGYSYDNLNLYERDQTLWTHWAQRRAADMTGDESAWKD